MKPEEIIKGYNDPDNRGMMKEFFLKAMERAKRKGQDMDVFFWNCHNTIFDMTRDLHRQKDIDSRALALKLKTATAKNDLKAIEEINGDIFRLNVENYSLNANTFTEGKCEGYLTYREVRYILNRYKFAKLEYCRKPEEMVNHFRKTSTGGNPRTPLSILLALDMTITDDHFSRFHAFVDQLPDEERKSELRIAIDDIEDLIKRTKRNRQKEYYRQQIEVLRQKLEGTTVRDWDGLRLELMKGEYIEEVSKGEFNHVMNHHYLPDTGKPVKWIGKKTEGTYFSQWYNFEMPEFNKCFVSKNGKPFAVHNISKILQKRVFTDILNKYPPA